MKDTFTNWNKVVVPDPNMLLDHFIPLSIITHFVNSSNHYHKRRKERFPDFHDQFIFLWQNVHIYNVEDLDVQAEEEAGISDEDDKEEVILYDKSAKHIQHDKDNSDEKDESEDDEEIETESEDDDETPPKCGITS
eukprot:15363519-Ditylum_brightwellii.AAC.1